MKKYYEVLFFGLFLSFVGHIMVFTYNFAVILGWVILITGRLFIFASILEYVDYKRAFAGEDLERDNKFRKKFRKIRRRYLG